MTPESEQVVGIFDTLYAQVVGTFVALYGIIFL